MARKIIKLVFLRPKEIRVLSQEDYLAYHRLSTRKIETKALCLCVANACKRSAGTGGGGHRNDFIEFFPPAFVNSQRAQVNRPKILERMVSGSSPLCSEVFVFFHFFLFQVEDLENYKSFRCEIMKKQPHIISGKS